VSGVFLFTDNFRNVFQQDKSFFSKQDSILITPTSLPITTQIADSNIYQFDSKMWVHRVNSLERLAEIEPLFKGMELNVVFEEYLTNIKNPNSHYYWIDLKKLTPQNVNEITQRLNHLTQNLTLRETLL
jgi:hypothetical protein